MQVRPGMRVTREELQNDLNGIQATGWFSDVRIVPQNGPLGVQVVVQVQPFPPLSAVEINGDEENLLSDELIEETFASDYGRTLNLNDLQQRMKALQTSVAGQGYSLARVSGPERVRPEGVVTLKLLQGSVSGVEVQFLTQDGDDTDENGNSIRGKTRDWVITREVSIQPGDPFDRNALERDIKRLYATQLFSDVKVTLRPVPEEPGDVVIVPPKAWHQTYALEPSCAVASQFCGRRDAPTVFEHMLRHRSRPDDGVLDLARPAPPRDAVRALFARLDSDS